MDPAPPDIVDRVKPVNLHGVTWHRHTDAMLEYIGRLATERDNALDELVALLEEHPELSTNNHLITACLALL